MNKQIEEMANILCDAKGHDCNGGDDCRCVKQAEALYNAGYRKASDVARETVEAIKADVRKKEQYVNDLFGYGGYVIATTDLEDIICRYMFDTYEEAELRKKYESEGADDE